MARYEKLNGEKNKRWYDLRGRVHLSWWHHRPKITSIWLELEGGHGDPEGLSETWGSAKQHCPVMVSGQWMVTLYSGTGHWRSLRSTGTSTARVAVSDAKPRLSHPSSLFCFSQTFALYESPTFHWNPPFPISTFWFLLSPQSGHWFQWRSSLALNHIFHMAILSPFNGLLSS